MEAGKYRYTVQEDSNNEFSSDSSSDFELSQQVDLSSIYSHEMDEVDRSYGVDLVNLEGIKRQMGIHFANSDYQSVLTLIPKLNRYAFLPPTVRIIVALSLFSLGRVKGALREISLVIEMNNDPTDRERYINYLITFFEKLDMTDKAIGCFNEIIAIAQVEITLNRDRAFYVKSMSERLTKYQKDLADCEKGHRIKGSSKPEKIVCPPLHEQAEKFMASNGYLDHYSVGRLCISTYSMIIQLKMLLKKNQKSKIGAQDNAVLTLLFGIIRSLAPSYLYDQLKSDIPLITSYIEQDIILSRAGDSLRPVNSVVDEIIEQCAKKGESFTGVLRSTVISHIVKGFVEMLNESYKSAIAFFEWSIELIEAISKKLTYSAVNLDYLCYTTRSVLGVLICRCYEFGNIKCDDSKLSALFVSLLKATNIGSKSEYSSGRLSNYFIAFGLMFERSAINQAVKIRIEDDNSTLVDIGLRLCQKSVEEMVRKYILAAVNKSRDDPSTSVIYDRIIWGILLCGGIHFKTLWFFISLKNYFMIEADFGPLQLPSRDDYKIFSKDDILSSYVNGWELIDKVLSLWISLEADEKENIWSLENGAVFLIPQVYHCNNKLVLIDQYYDENIRDSSTSFVQISPFHVRHKLKGHLKLHKRIISERIATSKDLIILWCTSFQECHGVLPCIASEFLPDL